MVHGAEECGPGEMQMGPRLSLLSGDHSPITMTVRCRCDPVLSSIMPENCFKAASCGGANGLRPSIPWPLEVIVPRPRMRQRLVQNPFRLAPLQAAPQGLRLCWANTGALRIRIGFWGSIRSTTIKGPYKGILFEIIPTPIV